MRKVHEALAPYVEADAEMVSEAVPVLVELLQGRTLGEQHWRASKRETATYVWRPVMARGVHPGDTVRVKNGSYEGKDARLNGLIGQVVALRNGVIVMHEGAASDSMGVRHAPDKLEVQIPILRGATK